MIDWDQIKDEESGRVFKVDYINHKTNVEASAWVDGNKITKFGTDIEAAYWTLQQGIYQELHFRINPNDYQK